MDSNGSADQVTGRDVQVVREALGLTQEELATSAGVSKKTAYNWEARKDDPLPDRSATKFANWATRCLSAAGLVRMIPGGVKDRLASASSFGFEVEGSVGNQASRTAAELASDKDHSYVIDALVEAQQRARALLELYPPEELAERFQAFLNSADGALDFAEQALTLRGDPEYVQQLADLVVKLAIDTGVLSLASGVRGLRASERITQRAAEVGDRAVIAGRADPRRAKPLERIPGPLASGDDDPDYSMMSEEEAINYGLAAHKGDPNVGPEDDPHET